MAKAAAPAAAASATSLGWPKAAAELPEVPFVAEGVVVAAPDPPVPAAPVVAALVGVAPVAAVPVAAVLVASVLVATVLVDAALVDASVGVPPAAVLAQLAELGRLVTPPSLQIFSAKSRASWV